MWKTLSIIGILVGSLGANALPSRAEVPIIAPEADTISSLGNLKICLAAWKIDNGHFPEPAPGAPDSGFLKEQMWPIYIRDFPSVDGWNSFWQYQSDKESYLLVSPGANRMIDAVYDLHGTPMPAGDDILLFNGELIAERGLLEELRALTLARGQKNAFAASAGH